MRFVGWSNLILVLVCSWYNCTGTSWTWSLPVVCFCGAAAARMVLVQVKLLLIDVSDQKKRDLLHLPSLCIWCHPLGSKVHLQWERAFSDWTMMLMMVYSHAIQLFSRNHLHVWRPPSVLVNLNTKKEVQIMQIQSKLWVQIWQKSSQLFHLRNLWQLYQQHK